MVKPNYGTNNQQKILFIVDSKKRLLRKEPQQIIKISIHPRLPLIIN